MSDRGIVPIDGDKLLEIIEQMTVLAEQVKQAQVSILRITMLMHEATGVPYEQTLARIAAKQDV